MSKNKMSKSSIKKKKKMSDEVHYPTQVQINIEVKHTNVQLEILHLGALDYDL